MPRFETPHIFDDPNARRLVDPEEINQNFREVARLLNGNLGVENLSGARGVASTLLQMPRSLFCVPFNLSTSFGVWPANGQLLAAPVALRLVSVDVYQAAGGFAGSLLVGATTKATLTDYMTPARGTYRITDITSPALAALDVLVLNVTAGSVRGVHLWFTAAHAA